MSALLYAKISMILTVGLVGLNLHQLFSSYKYVQERIQEFKAFVIENEGETGISILSWLFYVIVPAVYLFFLLKAEFANLGLMLISLKLILSGTWAWWVQRRVLSLGEYDKWIHMLSKSDNVINIVMSAGITYFLIFT